MSLYRRHRPQTFADVVGQPAIVRTLSNAITNEKVHHAYLFVGSRGTGKTSVAKILARSLNCVNGPTLEPCGECEACTAITNSTSLDVIEMDAASNNSVDDIRDLREKVGFAPTMDGWKVYILDEAHMLSGQAWNAFLKTLEEPPPRTTFVLATTEAHKVLPTIVDRCHRFDFHRPSLEQITTVLKRIAAAEGIEADDRALAMIARSASGSFRDAIGTLDQLVTYGGKQVSFEDVMELLDVADAELVFAATDAVIGRDPGAALRQVQELSDSGRDPVQFMRDLTGHLRHLIVVQTLGEPPDSFSVTADQVPRLEGQARDLPQAEAVRAIDLLADAIAAVKEGADSRTQLELALLKAARPRADASIEALLMRLERLEQGTPEGGTPGPVAPPPKRETPTPTTAPATAPEATVATPPSPAPPPLQGDVELERLWPAVLERACDAEGGEMMAALLAEARPVALEDDVLVLSYPASASFNKRKIEDTANSERLGQALRLVSGRPLAARFEIHDGPESHDESGTPPPRLTEDEVISRFKSEFDAEDVADQQRAGDTTAAAEEN